MLRRLVATGLVVSAMLPAHADPEIVRPEYEVKAAYLLNFTRYVAWPASSFDGPDAPFVIGIYDDNPFGQFLETTVAGRTSQGRPVHVRYLSDAEGLHSCHVVFFGRDAQNQRGALERLRGSPVLTVGESTAFSRKGGGVHLLVVGRTVQFDVNRRAVDQAGLTVSSRMLNLAHRVVQAGPPEK